MIKVHLGESFRDLVPVTTPALITLVTSPTSPRDFTRGPDPRRSLTCCRGRCFRRRPFGRTAIGRLLASVHRRGPRRSARRRPSINGGRWPRSRMRRTRNSAPETAARAGSARRHPPIAADTVIRPAAEPRADWRCGGCPFRAARSRDRRLAARRPEACADRPYTATVAGPRPAPMRVWNRTDDVATSAQVVPTGFRVCLPLRSWCR